MQFSAIRLGTNAIFESSGPTPSDMVFNAENLVFSAKSWALPDGISCSLIRFNGSARWHFYRNGMKCETWLLGVASFTWLGLQLHSEKLYLTNAEEALQSGVVLNEEELQLPDFALLQSTRSGTPLAICIPHGEYLKKEITKESAKMFEWSKALAMLLPSTI